LAGKSSKTVAGKGTIAIFTRDADKWGTRCAGAVINDLVTVLSSVIRKALAHVVIHKISTCPVVAVCSVTLVDFLVTESTIEARVTVTGVVCNTIYTSTVDTFTTRTVINILITIRSCESSEALTGVLAANIRCTRSIDTRLKDKAGITNFTACISRVAFNTVAHVFCWANSFTRGKVLTGLESEARILNVIAVTPGVARCTEAGVDCTTETVTCSFVETWHVVTSIWCIHYRPHGY
jgi:hypothetical protein